LDAIDLEEEDEDEDRDDDSLLWFDEADKLSGIMSAELSLAIANDSSDALLLLLIASVCVVGAEDEEDLAVSSMYIFLL
jgi:hypothetical protein